MRKIKIVISLPLYKWSLHFLCYLFLDESSCSGGRTRFACDSDKLYSLATISASFSDQMYRSINLEVTLDRKCCTIKSIYNYWKSIWEGWNTNMCAVFFRCIFPIETPYRHWCAVNIRWLLIFLCNSINWSYTD